MYLAKITKKITVVIKKYKAKRSIREKQEVQKIKEDTILYYLLTGKTPIEVINTLELVTFKVKAKLSETKEEYQKQIEAINEYLD